MGQGIGIGGGGPGVEEAATDLVAAIGSAEARARYAAGSPWPHLVLDGVIPAAWCRLACEEAAEVDDRHVVRQRSRRIVKDSVTDPASLGPTVTSLLQRLLDDRLVGALRTLTGIDDLVADPTLAFGGLWITPAGGWQRLHQDFVRHPASGLFNRVVAIAYLSPWAEGDGGELEMWDAAASGPPTLVEPRPGRLVVFEPSAATLHAVRVTAAPRVALGIRCYSATPPPHPPRPLLRQTVRRPGERWIDVLPSAGEAARMLSRLRAIRRGTPGEGRGHRSR